MAATELMKRAETEEKLKELWHPRGWMQRLIRLVSECRLRISLVKRGWGCREGDGGRYRFRIGRVDGVKEGGMDNLDQGTLAST